MNQHLGATYALSVILVVSSAVAFYRVDGPKGPPRPPGRVSGPSPKTEATAAAARSSEPRPGLGPSDPSTGPRPAAARVAVGKAPGAGAEANRVSSRSTAARPSPRASDPPRSGFTRVEEGEDLTEVSRRLYGSAEMAAALWRANRDQLASPATPLEAGMVLRTP